MPRDVHFYCPFRTLGGLIKAFSPNFPRITTVGLSHGGDSINGSSSRRMGMVATTQFCFLLEMVIILLGRSVATCLHMTRQRMGQFLSLFWRGLDWVHRYGWVNGWSESCVLGWSPPSRFQVRGNESEIKFFVKCWCHWCFVSCSYHTSSLVFP